MTGARRRPVPTPAESTRPSPRDFPSRFIPREELSSFAIWSFDDVARLDDAADAHVQGVSPATLDRAELSAEQLRAARQSGYQDGYRDGLVALEGFKRSFASQTTTQVGNLVAAVGAQLDALQQEIAQAVAIAAAELARQVVGTELTACPDRIGAVAEQAVNALMLSARHIVLRLHPDDLVLITGSSAEAIADRGGRLVADAHVSRGGCLVESDVGLVDATIEARWHSAARKLGTDALWCDAMRAADPLAPVAASAGGGEENDAPEP